MTRYGFDALNRQVSVRTPDPNGAAGGSGSGQHRAETVHLYNAAGECVAIVDPSGNRTDYGYDRLGRKTSETVQDPDHGTLTELFFYDAGDRLVTSIDRATRTRTFAYDRLDRLTSETWTDSLAVPHQIVDTYDTFGRRIETKEVTGSTGATTLSKYVYTYDDLDRLKSQSNQGTWSDLFVKNEFTYNSAGQLTQDLETITRGQTVTQSLVTYTSDNLDRVTLIEQLPIGTAVTATPKQVEFTYNLLGEVTAIDRRNFASGVWENVVHTDLARDQAGRLVDLVHKKGSTTFADYDYYYDLASQIRKFASAEDGARTIAYDPSGQLVTAGTASQIEFNPATIVSTGSPTTSVRTADINNDGKLDVLAVNLGFTGSFSVLLGNGDGTFNVLAPRTIASTPYTFDALLLDLNSDGKLDVVTIGHVTDKVVVLFGNGDGTFGTENYYTVGGAPIDSPISIAAGDLNHDGILDLVTANYESDTVSVLLGSGNGVFGTSTNYAVGLDPMAVALGDLNQDGHLDLVTADSGEAKVTIRYGTGTGTFGTAQQLAVAFLPTDVVVADVTADGRLDILAACFVGDVALLKGTASGFAALQMIEVGDTPFALIVQDMDRDSIADLVTASQLLDTFAIRKGLGDGSFAPALTFSVEAPGQSGIYQPFAIVAGDLTGEGNPDVVVANYQNYPYLPTQPWSVSVITRKAATAEHFAYDAGGVRTGAGSGGAYVAGDHNELDADGKYSYQYDRLGNLSLRTETATGKVTEYAWDNHNRLTKVTYLASAGGAITGTAEYAYDMNGRRIRRKVDVDGQAGFEIDERFAYDLGDLALVFDASGSLTNRYLSADAVDAALAEDDFAGGAANATEWLLADHQGSVRDIVRETGTEVTHVSYDSFGNITGVTGGVPVAPRIGYTGQERDPETGLMYYGARYYDPKTGRFISQDPTGYGAGDINLYRYVHNSPVIFVDPMGLRLFSPVQQAFNAVSNTIGNAFNSWGNSLSNLGRAAEQIFAPAAQQVMSSWSSSSLQSVVGMGNRSFDIGAVPMPSFTGNLPAPAAMPNIGINQLANAWEQDARLDNYVSQQQASGWSNWQASEWDRFSQQAGNALTVATAPLDILTGVAATALTGGVGGLLGGGVTVARGLDNFQAATRSLLYDENVTPYLTQNLESAIGQRATAALLFGVDFVTPGVGGEARAAVNAAETSIDVIGSRRVITQVDTLQTGGLRRLDDLGSGVPKSNAQLRREWEEINQQPWPKDPATGRNQDVSHVIPRADGGPDTVANIEPLPHEEHVQMHKQRGDYKRWGARRSDK